MNTFFRSLIAFSLLLIFSVVASAQAPQPATPLTNRITVSGTSEIKVVPDEAVISIDIETADKVLQQATDKNDERVKKVLETIKTYGVDSKHIRTNIISVAPQYETERYRREPDELIKYYTAKKQVVATLKDLSKLEPFLKSIYGVGITSIADVDFRTTKLREYRDQARQMAVRAAKEKATLMAKVLDQKIGKALTIEEGDPNSWSGGWYGGQQGAQGGQNISTTAPRESDETKLESGATIAIGQISVSATVTVQFELP